MKNIGNNEIIKTNLKSESIQAFVYRYKNISN